MAETHILRTLCQGASASMDKKPAESVEACRAPEWYAGGVYIGVPGSRMQVMSSDEEVQASSVQDLEGKLKELMASLSSFSDCILIDM